MSINWVMLTAGGAPPFVLLENERVRLQVPSNRTGVEIHPVGDAVVTRVLVASGTLYLTNQRLVMVSSTTSANDFRSFLIGYGEVKGFRLETPWFGVNKWRGLFRCTDSDTGLVTNTNYEMVVKFNEGGVTEFTSAFAQGWNDRVVNAHIDEELPRYE